VSVNLTWPKYTAHGPAGPCGHQHDALERAHNCACNLSQRHRGIEVLVRRRTEDGMSSLVAKVSTTTP